MSISRKFLFWFAILTAVTVPILAVNMISGAYGPAIMYFGFYLFVSYFLYIGYVKKMEPKYPLGLPPVEQDVYFPRSSIPRPIFRDYREHPEFFERKKEEKPK